MTAGRPRPAREARSAARLLAVQALYQMDVASADLEEVVEQFLEHPPEGDEDGAPLAQADEQHFKRVVRGVVEQQEPLDRAIARCLAEGWTLARIDSTLRAVLRAATYELSRLESVPARVAITEYLDITHAFFAGDEAAFVNGVLDRLARQLRPAEFSGPLQAGSHDGPR